MNWYVATPQGSRGPLLRSEVRETFFAMSLPDSTQVWSWRTDGWKSAEDVDEIMVLLRRRLPYSVALSLIWEDLCDFAYQRPWTTMVLSVICLYALYLVTNSSGFQAAILHIPKTSYETMQGLADQRHFKSKPARAITHDDSSHPPPNVVAPSPTVAAKQEGAASNDGLKRLEVRKDGTVYDHKTRLIWIAEGNKRGTWNDAMRYADECMAAGFTDWRIPTIDELIELEVNQRNQSELPFTFSEPLIYWSSSHGEGTDRAKLPLAIALRNMLTSTYEPNEKLGIRLVRSTASNLGTDVPSEEASGTQSEFDALPRLTPTTEEPAVFLPAGDGAVLDLSTQLLWTVDGAQTMGINEAFMFARKCRAGGYNSWRVPTADELISLRDSLQKLKAAGQPNPLRVLTRTAHFKNGNYWSSTTKPENCPDVTPCHVYLSVEFEGDHDLVGFIDDAQLAVRLVCTLEASDEELETAPSRRIW